MHIPENYLSTSTCAVMTAAMLPVWGYSINKVRTEIPKAKMPLLGIGAAFSFLGMMFNVPLPGGTTGHAVGGTLIAILTGSPAAGCISVSIALLIQALLFGDGGMLAFGANCFNMAFVLPYLGFFLYKLLFKKTGNASSVQRLDPMWESMQQLFVRQLNLVYSHYCLGMQQDRLFIVHIL